MTGRTPGIRTIVGVTAALMFLSACTTATSAPGGAGVSSDASSGLSTPSASTGPSAEQPVSTPSPLSPAGSESSSSEPSSAPPGSAAAEPPVVDTSTGSFRGLITGGTRQYLGIRYAEAPTGSRRWTLPEPTPDTDDVQDATKPGSACPQGGDVALAAASTDEDCLFVNVTVPTRASTTPLPVMVWWHGGGFTSGAGSQYDAARLAARGSVMVVTANYRLGMFGYLGLPGLAGSGNFGLADQFAALRWAKGNAAAFGGDPGNVTVFGESAGGTSVCAALTSPAAKGLVNKAIFSSGSCRLAWPSGALFPGVPATGSLIPLEQSEALGATAAAAAGCRGPEVLSCLRSRPVAQIVKQATTFGNPLAYGTDLLPEDPATAIEAGQVLKVPVISGGNRDEHRSFIGGLLLTDRNSVTAQKYPALIRASFGRNAAVVQQQYPLSDYESAPLAWSTVVTDAAWACTTTHGARDLAAAGATVYSYEFADRSAPDVSGVASSGLPQGAAHATDLPYLFDLGGKNLLTQPGQEQLSDTMIELWTSFAHTGRPAAEGVPNWPATSERTAPVLQLGNPRIALVDHRAEHLCDFWESIRQG